MTPEEHFQAGRDLQRGGKYEEALGHFETALEVSLSEPEILRQKAICLGALKRFEEAKATLLLALAYEPNSAMNWTMLGHCCGQLGQWEAVTRCYDAAYDLSPLFPLMRWNRALWLLHQGTYGIGFEEYAWGKVVRDRPIRTLQGEYRGGDCSGRTLFLWQEQGAGDAIQFLRYVTEIKKKGNFGRVAVEVTEPLVPLALTIPGIDQVISKTADMSIPVTFDYHCSLMDLPGILAAGSLYWQPKGAPYIPRPARTLDRSAFRVGVCWQGNPKHSNDWRRSIPVETLRPLAGCGALLFPLQPGAERPPWAGNVVDIGRDWLQTAEAIAQLDLVVTVDTAVAHLAGAMGVPVWILLPAIGDWRWGLTGSRTPWYDSALLWRQTDDGEWGPVIEDVAKALASEVKIAHSD